MQNNPVNPVNPVSIPGAPAWLPPSLVRRPDPVRVVFRTTEPERNVYHKRKHIPVSRWAEQGRMVTRGPLEGTPWRNRTTPYLAGIMDASFYPGVQEIYVCSPPQVGKSALVDTCIGYAIDRDPGPVLYTYPDEDTCKENMRDRILPMIRLSGVLRRYLTGVGDDESSYRVNLQHMQVYMAWARSAAKLGNKSIRYCVADETDKYPDTANLREAAPIDLLRKRQTTYRYTRRLWAISTPTIETGTIWQLLTTEAQAVFDYWVRCPSCRTYQVMLFDSIKWPSEERDPEKILSQDLARYECVQCKTLWDDHRRDLAVRRGHWRERESGRKLFPYLREERPLKIGFHLRSWISPFVGISSVAAAFLRGVKDKNKLKDFKNAHCAEPWKDYTMERKEDRILALRDDRPRGVVPGGGRTAVLVGFVDTQDTGFWYTVRAFGWGLDHESWLVREGYVDTFEAVAQVLWAERYADPEGNEYAVRLALQDAMGSRTAEVYDFVRLHLGRIFPTQGVDTRKTTQPYTWSTIDYYPPDRRGMRRPIPGGLKLLRVDVNFFKNLLAGKLEVKPDDPGAFRLHSETDEEYARQMCAETVDVEKQVWINPHDRPNHYWDCEVGCLVAADVLRVKYWKKEEGKAQGSRLKAESNKAGWVRGGGGPRPEGWLKR